MQYTWNSYNIVNQLYLNLKKKEICSQWMQKKHETKYTQLLLIKHS